MKELVSSSYQFFKRIFRIRDYQRRHSCAESQMIFEMTLLAKHQGKNEHERG